MKKTVKINLSGIIFHIDEDAYEQLNAYLVKIHNHFRGTEGGDEIINDIEIRMAELFQSRLSESKQVITSQDVAEVTKTMGNPEDFTDQEKGDQEKEQAYSAKKLYRDPDNAIFGGVAAGIGAYLNIDPVWIRLLFVLLMLGYGFVVVIYILLWIFIPKAETYAQKIEMRGEKITVSNIEKNVKREYEEVKGNFRKFRRSEPYKNITKAMNEIFYLVGRILKVVFNIILVLIGIAFVFLGIAAIFSVLGVSFFDIPFHFLDIFDIEEIPFYLFLRAAFSSVSLTVLSISIILLVFIPIFFIIYAGIKLLTNFRANDKAIVLTGVLLWIAALLYIPGNILWHFRNLGIQSSTVNEQTLEVPGKGNLILTMDDSETPEYHIDKVTFSSESIAIQGLDKEGNLCLMPSVKIDQSKDEQYRIRLRKVSRGESIEKASLYAKEIHYDWNMTDSTLNLPSHFKVPYRDQYRLQHLEVTVMIPEGKNIIIDEVCEEYLDDIENRENFWSFEMGDKVWKMKDDELVLLKNLN